MSPDKPVIVPDVSIVIANHNGADALMLTIPSLMNQIGVHVQEILLVDNQSTDDSIARVSQAFPSVRIVSTGSNRGPNVARQLGIDQVNSPLVLVMDNDLVLSPEYISKLANVFELHPESGAVSGKIRYYHQPDQVQYNGVDIHYIGEIRLHDPAARGTRRCTTVSAGAMLVSREVVQRLGGFDPDYVFGWEDGDLAYRMSLAGNPCWIVSEANAFHQSKVRGLKWVKLQVRNRWWFLRKNYHARTFWLALPAILLFQVAVGILLVIKGHGREFLAGTWEGWRNGRTLAQKRQSVQRWRRVSDRDLLCGDRFYVPQEVNRNLLARGLASLLFAVFSIYWLAIRLLIRVQFELFTLVA
ncbi:MAG TPA: glycosyltransferase family 2 protein [Kiritimatiellia bacterium]|nr:glycosyltransferase family 2 protein [Kiritimatiellia bacterium]HMP33708.1 glycosyltransferase family 2 protein [Kiritimatiellia bacterium]